MKRYFRCHVPRCGLSVDYEYILVPYKVSDSIDYGYRYILVHRHRGYVLYEYRYIRTRYPFRYKTILIPGIYKVAIHHLYSKSTCTVQVPVLSIVFLNAHVVCRLSLEKLYLFGFSAIRVVQRTTNHERGHGVQGRIYDGTSSPTGTYIPVPYPYVLYKYCTGTSRTVLSNLPDRDEVPTNVRVYRS